MPSHVDRAGTEAHQPAALGLGVAHQRVGEPVGGVAPLAGALEPPVAAEPAEGGAGGVGPDAQLAEQPHQRGRGDEAAAVEPVVTQDGGQQLGGGGPARMQASLKHDIWRPVGA